MISGKEGLIRGFLTGISNPKDILFFISFFPQFIAVTQDFTASIMTLSLVWIIFDFSVLSLYILTVKQWVPESHGRKIEIISSLFLLVVSYITSVNWVISHARRLVHTPISAIITHKTDRIRKLKYAVVVTAGKSVMPIVVNLSRLTTGTMNFNADHAPKKWILYR